MIMLQDAARCAWLGELDSQEESDEISNEFDIQSPLVGFFVLFQSGSRSRDPRYIPRSAAMNCHRAVLAWTSYQKHES